MLFSVCDRCMLKTTFPDYKQEILLLVLIPEKPVLLACFLLLACAFSFSLNVVFILLVSLSCLTVGLCS